MQKNFHTDERLSFLRPNAESTMNGTWTRKDFNNSAFSSNNKSAKSPPKVKIDARTYTDVQSRGLASRIVKYHESGTRFNRSISLTNLCSKSNSPLSVKKLEAKPQLRYDKAIKQNVSMTHIAPPDKSLFYGNTLSGLLRSSSVITLQQNDEDLSSENRPIIHPPVTEKEMQPTRSVLEVLKEISRKRINNEVLPDNDEIPDTSKKYCGRVVDSSHFNASDYRIQQMQAPLIPPPTYKRQRESAVDGYVPSCLSRDLSSYQSKVQQPDLPASPEQQSKRRHCNYNNDITSSLSSSAKSLSSKRKLYEHDGYKRQEKVLRYQSDVRLPEISSAISYGNKQPITPLPNTPQTVSIETHIPAMAVKKSVSAPLPTVASSIDKSSIAVKPKLTLFNRNYETKVDDESSAEPANDDSNEDDNAYAGINFVKPKKSATGIGGTSASNLVMQRTRKSKLALMLSGLRGELYLGDEEEEQRVKGLADTKKDDNKKVDAPQATLPAPNPLILTNTLDDKQKLNVGDKPDSSDKNTPPTVVASSVATSTITPVAAKPQATKITSPLTGIKLTPIAAPAAISTTSTAPTFNFGIKTSTTSADVSKPLLNFGTPTSTSNATPATTSATTATFSFGLPTSTTAAKAVPVLQFPTPATSSVSAAATSSAVAANTAGLNFNFTSSSTANSTPAATAKSEQSTATTAGFSFGNAPTSSAASTTSTFSTTTTTTPAFTFGGLAATKPADNPPATTTAAAPAFSFGGLAAAQPNNNSSATPAFNFGGSANAAVAKTTTAEAPKMFSFSSSPKTVKPPTASVAFSFGDKSNALENKTAQPAALFGGGNMPASTAPPTFGSLPADQTKNNAPSNSFVFGAKPVNQSTTPAPPAFGANSSLAPAQENKSVPANSFLFGSANQTTLDLAAKPTFGSSANNNSNSVNLFGLSTANSSTTTPALAAAATTATNENNAKPSSAFSFSNAATQQNAFSFGAANTTTNAGSDSSKTTNLFGGTLGNNQQSKTFSFGSQNTTASANEPAKAATAATTFNFSSANQGNNGVFAFAGAGSDANSNKPPIANSFGAIATNKPTSGGFSFGQTNAGASSNSGIFDFGAQKNTNNSTNVANPTANVKPTTTTNNFGAFSNSSASSGGFVFGANAKATTPSFGSAVSSNNAPSGGLVFGGTQQQNNSTTATSAGNLFASASTATAPQTGNLFGGATNTSAASTNIFGNKGNSTPVFGASSAAGGTTTPTNNLFAVPASASTERPIRRATRRLAKP